MIQVRENPFGIADFHGCANRICEGTEQIHQDIERISNKKRIVVSINDPFFV